MISNLPVIKLPEFLTQLGSMELKNTKQCHSEIVVLIESDKFLSVLVTQIFREYSKKGGLGTVLGSLGWQGFRNRITEAYLYYARYGHYPQDVHIDEVKSALEFEKRFDFLSSETNGRIFLLGVYLKMCEIEFEKNESLISDHYFGVPHQVDEILATGRSRLDTPDWLIVVAWSFFNKFGKEKSLQLLKTSKGNIDEIVNEVSKKDYGDFIMDLLIYGHAISETQIFTEEKV